MEPGNEAGTREGCETAPPTPTAQSVSEAFSDGERIDCPECGADLDRTIAELPELTTYRREDMGTRIPRLARAFGGMDVRANLLIDRLRRRWSGAVVALHDHKGTMQVHWRSEADYHAFADLAEAAWADVGECVVEHYLGAQ